jgi:hypothetical protein
MASTLEEGGVVVDRGCKNLNRLYFACVTPRAEAWMGARVLSGEPMPVAGERQRREAERAIHDAVHARQGGAE